MKKLKECKAFRVIEIRVRFESKTEILSDENTKEVTYDTENDYGFQAFINRPQEEMSDKRYERIRKNIQEAVKKVLRDETFLHN